MINVGDDAPDFLVRSTTDKSIWLRSMRGRPVVLHFFPKAPPPSSAALIERLGEAYPEIRSFGAEVIGILLEDLEPRPGSPPPPRARFPLVSDHSTQIARAYGVFRRLLGSDRPFSFGISEAGMVEAVFEIDPEAEKPSADVTAWLRARMPVDHEASSRRPIRLEGEIVAERYQLKRRLAEGGIGVVWVAEHLELRQEVAIKLLKESTRADPDHAIHILERFRHEAQVSALLGRRTAHIVHAQDAGFSEVGPYLVMELIDGHTLADEIDTMGPLTPERYLPILEQVAEAVSVAHDVGVVHRDLKPTNILLVTQPNGGVLAKVADFGLAKTINEQLTLDRPQETGESTVVGTVDFMSPEQLRAGQPADPRMDVWALGVVTYEALTARLPFEGPSVHAIMAKIVTAPFPRASSRKPTLPIELDAWFDRALAKDLKARFKNPQELVEAYRKAIARPGAKPEGAPGGVTTTLLEAPGKAPPKTRNRTAILTGVAAGLVIGGTIASVLGVRYGMRANPTPPSSGSAAAETRPVPAAPPDPGAVSPADPQRAPAKTDPAADAAETPPTSAPAGTGSATRSPGKPKGRDPSSVY
ncbi:MAG TPA: protein kinase [Polyangiaceae bacterium]|jgi:serine/threonine-protein kinase|nr:protein kinase [Polyangiaceae bacterium]